MRYLADMLVIIGWMMLAGAVFVGLGAPGVVGYIGGTLLAIGLVLGWRNSP